jgi:hypothetical protein
LALTSPTKGGRSVGIVRLRTQATEFVFICTVQIRGKQKVIPTPYITTSGVVLLYNVINEKFN